MRNFKWEKYHTIWLFLLIGWVFNSADRSITGPVITWMIQNHVSFLQDAAHPYALGGFLGSLLFTGYMLTQFPGGMLGDKYGYRTILTISLIWAGIATLLSGLFSLLIVFIILRITVGLGEGAYYSNDRALVIEVTPYKKRNLGMGVVITGLAIGLTLGTLSVPYMIELGENILGKHEGWRMPFIILGIATLLVGICLYSLFKRDKKEMHYRNAFIELFSYSLVFLVAILLIYKVTDWIGLSDWIVAVLELILAFTLIAFSLRGKNKNKNTAINLFSKNLLLMYLSAVAILWNLWFFSYWSISIVTSTAGTSFLQATLTAAFNAGAGILGYPVGGFLADYVMKKKWSKKSLLCFLTFAQGALTITFGFYLLSGGHSLLIMGILLFITSLFFNALQPISHSLTADMVEAKFRGSAFGMWNLIGEMGAVLSPVINGALRDATGSWIFPVFLDGIIILISFILILFVSNKSSDFKLVKRQEIA